MRAFVLIALLIIQNNLAGQSLYKEKKIKLPRELKEISGLENIGDSLLVAVNDGGNSPELFFLDYKGNIVHRCTLINTRNIDWEDLSSDDQGNLYIGDIGDNLSARRERSINKVRINEALEMDSILPVKINFSYSNQKEVKSDSSHSGFDCESLFWKQNHLFLIIKNRIKPWKGISTVYQLKDESGQQIAEPVSYVLTGNNSWYKDAITSADESNDTLYLLTYQRMIMYTIQNQNYLKQTEYRFRKFNQKESIAVNKGLIFIASERHWLLGGPYLYILEKK